MTGTQGRTAFAWRVLWQVFRWARHAFALVGALLLVYCIGFDYVVAPVDTTWAGMQKKPRLFNGVLVERFTSRFRAPRRWEAVAYLDNRGEGAVKRAIGLPGETVQMRKDGRIAIDGKEVSPPARLDGLRYISFGNLAADQPVTCGDGYYVLGDSLKDLEDSRFCGPIPRKNVIGRAWLILWPSERRGWVR